VTPAARLLAALQTTLTALEAGDVAAAAAGSQAVAAACAALGDQGLAPDELDAARALHARCAAVADKRHEHVVAELLQSATHRRASHAYGSTT
jgi:hypothetical protein